MLRDSQSDLGNLVHFTTNTDLNSMVETFSESQLRAYRGIENEFNAIRHIFAAIVGPAGTGKSYLLTGLIELAKCKGLIVSILAPSGVAAHLIGGTTIYNFFSLDINCNSSLEKGTVQVTTIKKAFLSLMNLACWISSFSTQQKSYVGSLVKITNMVFPGVAGMHVIMLGDPAQLPSPGRRDTFGTHLWHTFTILILREIK